MLRLFCAVGAILPITCGGPMFEDARAYTGRYLVEARLVLDADPQAVRPSSFEAGANWIVWLEAHRGGSAPLSESASRASIFIEFADRPALDSEVDLEAMPLQLSFEAGGQKIEYISRTAVGTLVLREGGDSAILVDLDVKFTNPILSEGERSLTGEVLLTPFDNF